MMDVEKLRKIHARLHYELGPIYIALRDLLGAMIEDAERQKEAEAQAEKVRNDRLNAYRSVFATQLYKGRQVTVRDSEGRTLFLSSPGVNVEVEVWP